MHPDHLLSEIFRLNPAQVSGLKKLRIQTVHDLLYHLPSRHISSAAVLGAELTAGQKVTVVGRVISQKAKRGWKSKVPMAEMTIEDANGQKIKAAWFHQAYMAKKVIPGATISLTGTVTNRKGTLYLANPILNEEVGEIPEGPLLSGNVDAELTPVYPETRGLSSLWFYGHINKILKSGTLNELKDPIPEAILKKYNLPSLRTALIFIHNPQKSSDAEVARKRFAFEEIFFVQLSRQKARAEYRANPSFQIPIKKQSLDDFIKRFPFDVTTAQEKAINTILADLSKDAPMTRLLEGDVGSGKTAVAATTAFGVVTTRPQGKDYGNLQVAYMAPTEILARQHFESFITYFRHLPIKIGLLMGTECRVFPSKIDPSGHTHISRTKLLQWAENGEIPILIGTHALIQKAVQFKHLAYVIVDEQHRFGTGQRAALVAHRLTRIEPQINADHSTDSTQPDLLHKDLSYVIRNIAFTVQNTLGIGHKESVYHNAMIEELKKRNIAFVTEKQIPIFYNKKKVGVYQPDLVIDDKIVVELKALPFIGDKEKKQLWTYLKGSSYQLALLINFGTQKVEFKRIVYEQARDPQTSASHPRSSALVPHYLSMTATPIPRTLALTIYGDLDLTLLDQMPAGRKPIKTEIVGPTSKPRVYDHIREELRAGRQAYVICPRIDEPDPTKEMALQATSATAEAKRLQKDVFSDFRVGLVHSKLKSADKEDVMEKFTRHEIDILVATSVVEVGVNVPNATIILIEGAERFGLAQLHQLRGRVLRSNHQAHCYLFTETKTKISLDRLAAIKQAKSGFELAELDLKLRGAGELSGIRQWGISDIGMEAIRNLKMVEAARTEARNILEKDPELKNYPLIRERIATPSEQVHLE